MTAQEAKRAIESLDWRLAKCQSNDDRKAAVLAWVSSYLDPQPALMRPILDAAGLEWREMPMGETRLMRKE